MTVHRSVNRAMREVFRSEGFFFYVIGNFVSYYIKTLREDATGAHLKVQADACPCIP